MSTSTAPRPEAAAHHTPAHRAPEPPADAGIGKTLAVVLGLTALLAVMLLAFALPAAHTGPQGIRVAAVGSPATMDRLSQQADGFRIERYPNASAARAAILDRTVDGAVVVRPGSEVQVMVATAAGPVMAQTIEQFGTGVAHSVAGRVAVEDVRAFPATDARGAGLAAGGLPIALGGWIGAVVIMMLIRTPARRAAAILAFSVVGGLMLTAILQFVIGTFDGNYLLTSLAAMLGIAATALTVLGLRSLLGGAGLAIAAVLLILLGNPLSGLTSAPEMLPSPWGAIGQSLPPGATGALLRDVALFDGHGAGRPLAVLLVWLVVGTVLVGVHMVRVARNPQLRLVETITVED